MTREDQADQVRERPAGGPPPPTLWRELRTFAIKIAAIAGIGMLLLTFVYGLHYNREAGMSPSLKDGDLVVYYRLDKDYRAGDLLLLVFQGEKQLRRVIACAGDTVDITSEGLVINGALQQEREIYRRTERYAEGIEFPLTLNEGEVFVLGDARDNVTDSRVYGPVKTGDTLGTVIAALRRRNL
ncbi:MAG: signal peptidase I [Oscillospiraceae bacterium]|nr:signal peptidase I [Oscillospiraceae bacterium]